MLVVGRELFKRDGSDASVVIGDGGGWIEKCVERWRAEPSTLQY